MLALNFILIAMAIDRTVTQRILPNMWRTYGHLVNMNRLLKRHDRTAFCALLHQTNLQHVLFMDGYTIFAPDDDTVLTFYRKHKYSYRKKRNFVKAHIYRGNLRVTNIHDGKSIRNLNGDHVYTNKMYDTEVQKIKVWIQGVGVIKGDIEFGQNILHLVNGPVVISKIPVIDYLRISGMHNIVYKMLRKNRIYFKFPFGTTLLAPLDHAFGYLPMNYRRELHTNQFKARMFLRSHVITRPMCHERMFNSIGWSRRYNNLGRSFSLFRDKHNNERCFASTGQVLVTTAVKDGWVYGITKAILPDITDPILQTIERIRCNKFLYYLINTGHFFKLISLLNDNTVFAPTDEAFDKLSVSTTRRLESDPKYLVALVMYHVVDKRYLTESFERTREIVASRRSGMLMRKRRLFLSSLGNGTVQHAAIISPDILALNGIIHLIDEVLLPPNQTIYSFIMARKRFTVFREVLKKINSPLIAMLKDRKASLTLIAPSNRAMRRLFRSLNATEKTSKYSKTLTRQLTFYLSRHVLVKPYFITSNMPSNETKLETHMLCHGEPIDIENLLNMNDLSANDGTYNENYRLSDNVVPGRERDKKKIPDKYLCRDPEGNGSKGIEDNVGKQKLNNTNYSDEGEYEQNNEIENGLFGDEQNNEINSNERTSNSSRISRRKRGVQIKRPCNKTWLNAPAKNKALQPQKCKVSPLSFVKVGEFNHHLVRRNIPTLNGVIHVVNRVFCLTNCPHVHLRKQSMSDNIRKKSKRKKMTRKKKRRKNRKHHH